MRYASLGSGSQGNATLIVSGDTRVLVDCGFTAKEAAKRLQRLGCSPESLSAVLVTHEHGDHIKGVGPLARKYNLPVYMTPGTYHQGKVGNLPQLNLIEGYRAFQINQITVQPVAVPHDAREPAQFVFRAQGLALGLLTDLGSLSEHVVEQYRCCHGLILEANHDPHLLAIGPYPPSLKQRVSGQWGHLSNAQALSFLEQIGGQHLKQLVVAHISQKNNCLDLVQREFAPWVERLPQVLFACQEQGFSWLDLSECIPEMCDQSA